MTRRRQARVTLADVARAARVSAMTVSNVLNDSGRVSEGTRDRVRSTVSRLGYVPNLSAARLTGSSLSRVGVVYPAGSSAFVTTLIAAIATEAASRGLQIIFSPATIRDRAQAEMQTRDLIAAGAEGVALVSPFAELMGSQTVRELDAPLAGLLAARPIEGMATVRIDNEAAAYAITTLLLDKGHDRIAVITGPADHGDSPLRLAGHRAALRARLLEKNPEHEVVGDFTFASGVSGAERLMAVSPAPTAIVCANDETAAGVLWWLNKHGLRVPDEVAVCGFDDTQLATRVWPTLTTIKQPFPEMAAVALDALATAFRARSRPSAMTDTVLPFALIERGSTCKDPT